jgi:hypothetical protein
VRLFFFLISISFSLIFFLLRFIEM